MYFDYARCSPASPEWREYILPRLEKIMDEYGVDGIYDDLGYIPLAGHLYNINPTLPSHISPSPELPEHDAALEDFLGLVISLIHKRGGLLKIHYDGTLAPACKRKVYDYLWVGESVVDIDSLRKKTNNYEPYVVPCFHTSRMDNKIENKNEFYLHTVPYMQFPLRMDGRPFTGKRGMVEGMNYRHGNDCMWTRECRRTWNYYQKHPDAPPIYGLWEACPGEKESRSRWLHHLGLYLPMVKSGTRTWIKIGDDPVIKTADKKEVTATLFVNDEIYMALANYGNKDTEVVSTWTWKNRESGIVSNNFIIPARELIYLQRIQVSDKK